MIKLILCDFTGVVVTGGHKKLCQILAEKYDLDFDHVYSIAYTKYFNQFATNKITEQEANEGPIKELGLNEKWQDLVSMYLNTHVTNPPMVELLKSLKGKYKLVLLTKNIKHYLDWEREKFNLDDLFDDIINTSEIDLPKASQETLEYILNRFQVKPEEIVYTDDQEENLEEAKNMGIHTIFYENFDQVEKELSKLIEI